ncbi:uncharacterized protein LOC106081658 isoform X2 [Stomoxys calcitrans]|nr:uncharacterized protein LOC106081658 isoform X2 [Stomoxys calcitrans]
MPIMFWKNLYSPHKLKYFWLKHTPPLSSYKVLNDLPVNSLKRQMYENSEKRHAIIMQLNDGKWDTKLFEGVNNELILKNIAELSALEKNLWNLYNKVEQEETSLLTKYTLASNEFYEAERMYRKILNVGWVFTSLVTSLLGFIVSNLWLFYHQSKAPSSELPKFEIKEEKNNQDSWTSYLHRNLRWTYSWTERFNK